MSSTTSSSVPAALTEAKYKKALDFAKLASKTYDWDDNLVISAGLKLFRGIDDIQKQSFSTPDYKKVPSIYLPLSLVKKAALTGLDFTVFEHKETRELVVAFRGTEPLSFRDWVADAKQALGNSSQYEIAVSIAVFLATSHEKLAFTGHSLGGGLATAAALATGKEAIVFDAAGISNHTIGNNELGLDMKHRSMVTNFNVVDCFVSDWNGKQDDTTIGTLPGIVCKQYGNIYWLKSISETADLIGIPDVLPPVHLAETFLAHAPAVYTYQLENKNFEKDDDFNENYERPHKRAKVVKPARKNPEIAQ